MVSSRPLQSTTCRLSRILKHTAQRCWSSWQWPWHRGMHSTCNFGATLWCVPLWLLLLERSQSAPSRRLCECNHSIRWSQYGKDLVCWWHHHVLCTRWHWHQLQVDPQEHRTAHNHGWCPLSGVHCPGPYPAIKALGSGTWHQGTWCAPPRGWC